MHENKKKEKKRKESEQRTKKDEGMVAYRRQPRRSRQSPSRQQYRGLLLAELNGRAFFFYLSFLLAATMMGNHADQILSAKYDNHHTGGGPVTLHRMVVPLKPW